MEVWRRLLGCFGESLIRKFGEEPPQEWIAGIASLDDVKVARGLRRLVLSGKPHPPSLPEFLRLCRMVADDDTDGPQTQSAALMLPTEAQRQDTWDIAANQHFLGYVTRLMAKDPRAWGAPKSSEQESCTRIALRYKHAWAQDMREGRGIDPATGEFIPYSPDEQKASWEDLMRQAEAAIALARAGAAA